MSKQEKDKWDPSQDPSEPSTSSGYRKPYSRSSRSLEHEKHSQKRKERIKSVSKASESDYDTDASTSTYYPRQHGSQQMGIKSESVEVKSESMEVKSEPAEVESEAMDFKSEIENRGGGGDTASEGTASTQTTQTTNRKKEVIFVSRPKSLENKKGTSGRQIILQANYFRLPTVPNWNLYMYRVDFQPDETLTVVRKGILKSHKEKFGSYIFDGTVLYAVRRLPDKLELTSTKKYDNTQIKINIRFVGIASREDPHYIVFFNIVMRTCMEYLQLQLVGRNYYDARNRQIIHQYKLELWPGYITAIRQYERDFMMCVEISYKVLRQETLLHVLTESYDNYNNQDFKNTFLNAVIGITVLTDYNNRTYHIEDVNFDVSPSSKFIMKSGEEISYLEYYQRKYRISISNRTQPLLVSRTKPKAKNLGKGDLVYLVPELCRPVGLSEKMREQFHLTRELSTHTKLSPESRIERLKMFNERLRRQDQVVQELNNWQMQLERTLVEVPARILSPEKLTFGRNFTINSGQGDWTRDMQRAPLLHCQELKNWVVLVTNRGQHSIRAFLDKLYRVSQGLSFIVHPPQICTMPDDSTGTYIGFLERILSKSIPQLMFCVASNNRSDRYAAIKKKCCIERPVPSQIILQKNLDGRNAMTIATKVAIQINCKLGGYPWKIDMPCRKVMAIGFDICRDSNMKGREYLAMVATVDEAQTQYFSHVSMYHNHEELGEQICEGVRKALNAFRIKTFSLPMYIMIYRDGVSDGQLSQVNEHEVESLKRQLEELYYGPNFKMTFIVVSKNTTRLFLNRRNPPIGTIVDDVITSPFKYDFFLVSQHVRQGTISPTAYNVMWDNSRLPPDIIQMITFKLTHMHYNCSSTVRSPAPCHYAKKLSSIVGRVIHQPANSQLQNQLFFL